LWFDEIRLEDLGKVGGKGTNLGELARAGLPVPQGFCVTAQTYRHFLALTGIDRKIDAELAADEAKTEAPASDTDELGSADQLSERIRHLIEGQPIPDEIAISLLDAYRQLHRKSGVDKVAVRSSATAEDLPGFSFAGQQDTYLGIRGDQAVLDAVKRCWASLWTSRALTYRRMNGFRHQDVYIAVVVQEMFPSQVSGVLFTADPLTGSRRKMIVSASYGLGEAVVSGIVTPDYWVLNRETGAVIEEKIGEKAERIDQAESGSGVVHSIVPTHERIRPCLTPDQLRELARIASGIEAHYGFPQDVEWGFSGTRFAILQAREVTGVPVDFREDLERWNVPVPPDDATIWSRAWSDFGQPGASTPLMYTIQQSFIHRTYEDMFRLFGLKSFLGRRMWQWHCCRPYWSSDYEERRLRLIPRFARNDDALCFWPQKEHARLRELPFDFWKLVYGQIHALLTAPRYSFWFCADTFYKEYPEQIARYEAAMNIDFETASVEQILASLQTNEQCFIDHSLSVTPGVMTYCYFLVLALSETTKNWCGDADQSKFGTLLSGLATRTVLGNIETWRLAGDIGKEDALQKAFAAKDASTILQSLNETADGKAYLEKIDAYIRENGHRGGSERDLVFPRWRHRPELLINALRSLATGDESTNAELLEARMVQRREQTTKELIDRLRGQRWGIFKAAIFRKLLRWTHKYVKFRDDQRFFADYYMAARHDFFNAIAKRLAGKNLIEKVDDIFFLGLEEIQDLWQGRLSPAFARRRIETRRAQY
jgi:pyruvate,water dikinase